MSIAHGGAGVLVAAGTAAAAAADHSLLDTIIVASAGVAGVVLGPIVSSWLRNRKPPPVDHHREVIAEQAQLVEHLLAELAELRGDNRDLDNELRRLRRRREK